jgi:hypothetical protein
VHTGDLAGADAGAGVGRPRADQKERAGDVRHDVHEARWRDPPIERPLAVLALAIKGQRSVDREGVRLTT